MKTINFICPHCSHLMTLPAAFEGKEGNCSSCKSSVTVVGSSGIETVARKSTTIESVAKSPTNPVLQTQSTNSIASPDTSAIRERLTRLQTAKQEYEQADAIQIQAAGKLQDAKAAVSTVFDPIGSSVVLAYTLGEINDTPLLGNVLEANRKLQQLQHDLAALEFAPAANIIQKTKVKAQRVILNQKIKQTEKQIIDCQFELGKNIFESKDYAFVACDTTKSALERLAAIQANIVEAENNLQLAISSLINLKTQLMAAVPLNTIEGTQTFDIAIGVSERQLAAIQSPAAEAPPIEPTPQTALGDPSVINVNPASQPLPHQTSQTRDRSGNKTKLVITASAVGIVILLIAGSLYIFLAGSGNTNNGISANVETAEKDEYDIVEDELGQLIRQYDAGLITKDSVTSRLEKMQNRIDGKKGKNISKMTSLRIKFRFFAEHLISVKPLNPTSTELEELRNAKSRFNKISEEVKSISANHKGPKDESENQVKLWVLWKELFDLPSIPIDEGGPDLVQKFQLDREIKAAKKVVGHSVNDEADGNFSAVLIAENFGSDYLLKFRRDDLTASFTLGMLERARKRLNDEDDTTQNAIDSLNELFDEWTEEIHRNTN
jgi:hypothetical protein